ncbi:MAG: RecQ family zinc-binding domain-containing protein, partial [Chloroflexota bacterium]|nr:RecQ family zinc-binding domain-containing protein [Chloroflexota bacterium]
NLALAVEVPADREARLLEMVASDATAPTIVYALRQADTERLATRLIGVGVRAAPYHAGLDAPVRSEVQDRFLAGDLACTVATVAFGMGVDKPDVRRVIHVHAPRSLEGYVQEVGRAGRDGAPAAGILLYDDADLPALGNFVEGKAPAGAQVRDALNLAFAPANRETGDIIAFSPQAVGDATDVDPLAVRTLFARLERQGVVRALTPAFDEYQIALQHDGEAVRARLQKEVRNDPQEGDLQEGRRGEDGDVWSALLASGKRGRSWITLSIAAAVQQTGHPYPTIRRVLRRVEEEGLVSLQASGTLHRYRVLRKPDRETDLPALLQAVDDALTGERLRLGAVRQYVLETACRQAHVLAYLAEPDAEPCGVCDLCTGHPPLDEPTLRQPDWRQDFHPATVRALAALGKSGPDPIGVARALCQISSTRSRPYRRHAAWGRLARAPYRDVLAAVQQALA